MRSVTKPLAGAVLVVGSLLAMPRVLAQTTVPPSSSTTSRPPVAFSVSGPTCTSATRSTVTVHVTNNTGVALTIVSADYTSPVPVPFPGGAGGTPFPTGAIAPGSSADGTDVLVADGTVHTLLIVYEGQISSSVALSIRSGTCPVATTGGSTPPTSAPPAVGPAFTG